MGRVDFLHQQLDTRVSDLGLGCRIIVECYRPDGTLRWRDINNNVVVLVGKNDLLNKYFTGAAYSATFYCGLKGSGIPVVADTQASHPTWSELTAYSQTNRSTVSMGTASGGAIDNSAAPAPFSMNSTITVYGVFMTTVSTKSTTSGILWNAADFTVSRNVINGDVLSVVINPTVT